MKKGRARGAASGGCARRKRMTVEERGRSERNEGMRWDLRRESLVRLLDSSTKLDGFVFLQEAINSKFNLKNRGCWSCML
jgi:hypothetical protein